MVVRSVPVFEPMYSSGIEELHWGINNSLVIGCHPLVGNFLVNNETNMTSFEIV